MRQQQFLEVLDRDEAERRWREVIEIAPRGVETVSLVECLGRVLAEDVQIDLERYYTNEFLSAGQPQDRTTPRSTPQQAPPSPVRQIPWLPIALGAVAIVAIALFIIRQRSSA